MKTSILLLLTLFALAACQKEAKVIPQAAPVKTTTTTTVPTTTTTTTAAKDTMPDKAIFKIQLVKDEVNNDETMFMFNKTASLIYDPNEDGLYFVGYGQESLSSISKDGRDLAISCLPYTPGMAIGLNVNTKTDGTFTLKLSYEKKIPANTQIWLKDTYLKDSVNVRGKAYKFNVVKTDTSSFGSSRFKLIIRGKAQ